MNSAQVDNHLQDVALDQLCFKGSKMRSVMIAIVTQILCGRHWMDEIEMPELGAADKNCIGGAMKTLAGRGIILRQEGKDAYRRSQKDASRGRVVWRYIIPCRKLAETFLKANDAPIPFDPRKLQPTIIEHGGDGHYYRQPIQPDLNLMISAELPK